MIIRRVLRLAAAAIRLAAADLRGMPFDIAANVVLASPLVPRPVRALAFRVMGMSVRTMNVAPRCTVKTRRLTLGRHTFVNRGCVFDNVAPVVVGDRCDIAMGVLFCTTTHEVGTGDQRAGELRVQPISVEDGCWIGARAVILPGVVIGAGCVVAAGAVVASDCAPHGVYAGVPARRVRDLAAGDVAVVLEIARERVSVR